MQCMQDACRAVKGDCRNILMMRADCGASGTLIKINPGLSSILTALHADCMQCMQAACRPVKMKLITPAFDWSFLVFLTLLPTSACFFSSLIWPLFTPWVTGGLYFLLHQNQLHPKIDKINGHLPHTKKLHVIISKLQVTETQKWCRIFYEKEEVDYFPHGSNPGFEIRPLLGMNQQTLLPEIEFFHILLSFFQKNWHDDVTVTIKIWCHHWVF